MSTIPFVSIVGLLGFFLGGSDIFGAQVIDALNWIQWVYVLFLFAVLGFISLTLYIGKETIVALPILILGFTLIFFSYWLLGEAISSLNPTATTWSELGNGVKYVYGFLIMLILSGFKEQIKIKEN